MKLYDLITSRRSIREFKKRPVPKDLLERLVNAARLAPQAANRQPLEYILINNTDICERLFSMVQFAGYLDWEPPTENQPAAYIAVLVNRKLQKPIWAPLDVGCASENICLAAWAEGVGSCLVGAFDQTGVRKLLDVPEEYDMPLIVALGYPAHASHAEEMKGDDVKYRRDADGTFHVPKRPLNKITHHNRF